MENGKIRKQYDEIEGMIRKDRKPTFSDTFLKFCDMREAEEDGLTDADIYNAVSMNRDLFCKIKNNREYSTRKDTVLAFAIALHLNLEQTQELLESAGYCLSDSIKTDLILKYFIEKKDYDSTRIDGALEHFKQPRIFARKPRRSKHDLP